MAHIDRISKSTKRMVVGRDVLIVTKEAFFAQGCNSAIYRTAKT